MTSSFFWHRILGSVIIDGTGLFCRSHSFIPEKCILSRSGRPWSTIRCKVCPPTFHRCVDAAHHQETGKQTSWLSCRQECRSNFAKLSDVDAKAKACLPSKPWQLPKLQRPCIGKLCSKAGRFCWMLGEDKYLQVIAYSGSCFRNLAHKVGFQLHQLGERKALSFSCVLLALHTHPKEIVSWYSQFVVTEMDF